MIWSDASERRVRCELGKGIEPHAVYVRLISFAKQIAHCWVLNPSIELRDAL
jgi:hypothetical protein